MKHTIRQIGKGIEQEYINEMRKMRNSNDMSFIIFRAIIYIIPTYTFAYHGSNAGGIEGAIIATTMIFFLPLFFASFMSLTINGMFTLVMLRNGQTRLSDFAKGGEYEQS